MQVALGMAAGIGIGFCLGLVFSRWDQKAMFALVTSTSDSLVRSALFPGLPKDILDTPLVTEPSEELYETEEAKAVMPDWLTGDDGPWDPERDDAD